MKEQRFLRVLEEKDPQPELLRNALRKVIEAYGTSNNLSEAAKQHHDKLEQVLTENGGSEIYTLVELFNLLGFRVEITVN